MIDRTTLLADPANLKAAHRQFRFDYSYWSHDGYTVSENGYYEPVSDKYISQVSNNKENIVPYEGQYCRIEIIFSQQIKIYLELDLSHT